MKCEIVHWAKVIVLAGLHYLQKTVPSVRWSVCRLHCPVVL